MANTRWYQFSLRSLLMVTVLCSVFCSIAVPIWNRLHCGSVQGIVTVDGCPLKSGSITFVPTWKGGAKRRAAIIQRGEYEIARVLTSGVYTIEIRAPQTVEGTAVEALPAHYNVNTTLTAEILRGPNHIDLALTIQSARIERSNGPSPPDG